MGDEKSTFGTKHLNDLIRLFEKNEKSRNILLSVLDMLRLAVITVNSDGCITFVNDAAQKILGDNHRNLLGKYWKDLLPLDKESRELVEKRIFVGDDEDQKIEAHLRFPDGREYWMDIELRDDPRKPRQKIFFLYDLSEIYDLRRQLQKTTGFHDLIGKSAPMQEVYQKIREAAKVDWNVLIEGETGTGKELTARAIHYSSLRKDHLFIAFNCAGLQDSLITSQLFGHKKGAFTGAVADHKGFFETAHRGTIFIDEIGDIPASVQTNLLRVLEEKEIIPVGTSKPVKVDIRILAATNKDLNKEVAEGRFRPDLFYRIRVIRIGLPTLAERREDIPLLVNAFLNQSCSIARIPKKRIHKETMRTLMKYQWPGNVRELKSAVEYSTLHSKGSLVKTDDLPPELNNPTFLTVKSSFAHTDQKTRILDALQITNGNRSLAAKQLGISRATLYRKLSRLRIKPKTSQ
jgi:PAS domain S-box-containing protein